MEIPKMNSPFVFFCLACQAKSNLIFSLKVDGMKMTALVEARCPDCNTILRVFDEKLKFAGEESNDTGRT